MPFSTDTSWPENLLNIFDITRISLSEPYNKPLHYALTDGSFTFFLSLPATPDEIRPCDAVLYCLITQQQKPILIMEMKDDRSDLRLKADAQMRQRYDELLRHYPISSLHGLSLLGTSLRIYCGRGDTGDITPCFVDHPSADCVFSTRLL
ncbi:uncharacterized protein EI90DRAFT_3045780 [Cantharellus anzutake]|uniref:uncharacterized protein n=1 Tax=Cantharellus anzutake TaxID=1750568 RepID=UPI0019036FC9|nr:uncharacterized protein EI90DRAFT_3045780 [Cantharellus anzutake]KAF8336451.1 hypothetical protein EI90DRAFT_3045780 [Cantharellus anzutake]